MQRMVLIGLASVIAISGRFAATEEIEQTEAVERPKFVWLKNWKEARTAAKEEQKPFVVFVTGNHCSACQRMKAETWSDRDLQARLAENFITVQIDNNISRKLSEQLAVKALPTTIVFSAEGKRLKTWTGYASVEKLQDSLEQIVTELKEEAIENDPVVGIARP